MSGTTTTPYLGLIKPPVGGSRDAWGGYLNTNADTIDAHEQDQLTEISNLSAIASDHETRIAALEAALRGSGLAVRPDTPALQEARRRIAALAAAKPG